MKSRLKGSFPLQYYRAANLISLLNSSPEFSKDAWHDHLQRGRKGRRENKREQESESGRERVRARDKEVKQRKFI